jgi:hypothetical protein
MVKYHAPRAAGSGGAKGVFKAAESWLRWFRKHGQNAPPAHGVPHSRGFPAKPLGLKSAKQREHIPGTPEYERRRNQALAQGKTPQSAWSIPERQANEATWRAWHNGQPVPRMPGKRQFETGDVVGYTGDGRGQTAVRVHIDESGQLHGHPANYKKRR